MACVYNGLPLQHLQGAVEISDYTAGNFSKLKSKERSMSMNRYTREICTEHGIHYISSEADRQFVVDVITINKIENATVQQKRSSSIPDDNLSSIISFMNDNRIYASDVTIIIGKFKGKSVQCLLLCQFWNCVTGPSRLVVNELLLEAIKVTKNNNVEATRSGGSNGIFKSPNKAFMWHILRKGVVTRHLKGSFLIPRKTALFLFYINNSGCPKVFSIPILSLEDRWVVLQLNL